MLIAIWPIGTVALFVGLSLRGRRRILERAPDRFTRAIKFLHADFDPQHYYWSSIELSLRSVLTGWVLLVDAHKSTMRLVRCPF